MSDQPEQNGAESSPPVVVPSIIEEVAADPVPARRAVSEDAFWGDDGERAGDPFDLEAAAARRTAGEGASSPAAARSVGDQITPSAPPDVIGNSGPNVPSAANRRRCTSLVPETSEV